MGAQDKFAKVFRVNHHCDEFIDKLISDEGNGYSSEKDIMNFISALNPSKLDEYRVLYFVFSEITRKGAADNKTTAELLGPYAVSPLFAKEENLRKRVLRSSDIPLQFVPIEDRICYVKTSVHNIRHVGKRFMALYEDAKTLAVNELRKICKNLRREEEEPHTFFDGTHNDGIVRFNYHNKIEDVQVDNVLVLHVFGRNDFAKHVYEKLKVQNWSALQQIYQTGHGLSTKIRCGTAYKFPALERRHLDDLDSVSGLILP
ncbi:MAG: hypothetical protein HY363_00345 [Candidatus Aenigmarchaeota archaeon]|nr:hypothetical protein [Candidatus Aenigmarchaeota archaeon]